MCFTKEEVISALRKNRIEKILIVNKAHELKGMVTFKDIQKSTTYPNASKDETGSTSSRLNTQCSFVPI